MKRQLRVRFSRPLLKADGERTGVLEQTFWVEYSDSNYSVNIISPESLTIEDGGRVAVFTLPYIRKWFERREIVNSTIFIKLKCDFILDCHHTPVDGEHLRGRLPSGDGRAGGLFESWFRVV
jgi:hypothetical protein